MMTPTTILRVGRRVISLARVCVRVCVFGGGGVGGGWVGGGSLLSFIAFLFFQSLLFKHSIRNIFAVDLSLSLSLLSLIHI